MREGGLELGRGRLGSRPLSCGSQSHHRVGKGGQPAVERASDRRGIGEVGMVRDFRVAQPEHSRKHDGILLPVRKGLKGLFDVRGGLFGPGVGAGRGKRRVGSDDVLYCRGAFRMLSMDVPFGGGPIGVPIGNLAARDREEPVAEFRVAAPAESFDVFENLSTYGLNEIGGGLACEDERPRAQANECTELGLEVNEEFSGRVRISSTGTLEKGVRIHDAKSTPSQGPFRQEIPSRHARPVYCPAPSRLGLEAFLRMRSRRSRAICVLG